MVEAIAAEIEVSTGGAGLIFLVAVVTAIALAVIPASLAERKGYSFVLFFIFGWVLLLPALIVVLVLPRKASQGTAPGDPVPPVPPPRPDWSP